MLTRIAVICSLAIAGPASAMEPGPFCWTVAFDDVDVWTAQPGWLSDASTDASVSTDGRVGCFHVPRPGRGMKWSLAEPGVSLRQFPYMVVRYRAENLNAARTDYLIYVDDGDANTELAALRPGDLVADGKWHVAAVDVSALTEAGGIESLAVQVQADAHGDARLWLEWLAFVDAVPDDVRWVGAKPKPSQRPDRRLPLDGRKWIAERSWLSNPGDDGTFRTEPIDGGTRFRVDRAGRGMKWHLPLPEAIELAGHRLLALRYRAVGAANRADYLLAVMGETVSGTSDYATAVGADRLIADGRPHTLTVDVGQLAARFIQVDRLAFQVQADDDGAFVELLGITLCDRRVRVPLAEMLPWRPAEIPDGFRCIPIGTADADVEPWLRHWHLADWFSRGQVTVHGIPFAPRVESPQLTATAVREKSDLRLPVGHAVGEVYVLLATGFVGLDEPAYGGGQLTRIADVDRFRFRLVYADGTVDECLPMNVESGRFEIVDGLQVVVAAADPDRVLADIQVRDATRQAAFAVAAVTVRSDRERRFPEAAEETEPWFSAKAQHGSPALGERRPPALGAGLRTPPQLLPQYVANPTGLVRVQVDGRDVPCDLWTPLTEPPRRVAKSAEPDPWQTGCRWFALPGAEGLAIGIQAEALAPGSLSVATCVRNLGDRAYRVKLIAPIVGPYRLCEKAHQAYYLYPQCGAVLDNRPCSLRRRYSGRFPVQFIDTFAPAQGQGLSLVTHDTAARQKFFLLDKQNERFTLGVEYPERVVGPGKERTTARCVVAATDGQPGRGLDAYRDWLRSWYRPAVARQDWFREVFNFRQRFLWAYDPLYDAGAGTFHLQSAIDEARREFGGIEYLHLFDWGNCGPYGRIYGRRGDYSPFDYLQGGRQALQRAIADVQRAGVPVGLYIEGYLLERRGKLGQKFGPSWQIVQRDGTPLYWPGSTEMMVCPAVNPWRAVQAGTYADKAAELGVDGMYVDQFGFANSGKDCYSAEHGHPVPSDPAVEERGMMRSIRRSVDRAKPGVVLYGEESPVDVTSQFQDGSFTYAMFQSQRTPTLVPLNVFRFAVPDFKTIEILFCDKPIGSWATGVKWVFFNGEAIWLEGPAAEWFEPETRTAIRRCHAILRVHRAAFTGLAPTPLIPTERGRVFANRFSCETETVYTLYNARHRTVRGPMLRVPHREGAAWYDAWNDRPVEVRRDGATDVLHLEIGPNDVGCVVRNDVGGS